MATAKVRQAIAAETSTLAPDLPKRDVLRTNAVEYEVSLVKAERLSPRAQDGIYDLFHANMGELSAASSFSYSERSKRDELFDPTGRYLLVRNMKVAVTVTKGEDNDTMSLPMPGAMPTPSANPRQATRKAKGKGRAEMLDIVDCEPEEILGYCSFRFDTEETLSSRDAEVIYCYELQLAPSARRSGLGSTLMSLMEDIGRKRGMEKAMLTCLKANITALAFYKKQGYVPDEIDPTRMAEEEDWADDDSSDEGGGEDSRKEADYVILSKSLR